MNYRLEIRPDALNDTEEAELWYDQRESGLGADFTREFLRAVDTLSKNPLGYRVRHRRKNIRWKLFDRFPYRVVYQTKDDLITIIAVLHSARHDRYWRERT